MRRNCHWQVIAAGGGKNRSQVNKEKRRKNKQGETIKHEFESFRFQD